MEAHIKIVEKRLHSEKGLSGGMFGEKVKTALKMREMTIHCRSNPTELPQRNA
jgi:hypothetical protein